MTNRDNRSNRQWLQSFTNVFSRLIFRRNLNKEQEDRFIINDVRLGKKYRLVMHTGIKVLRYSRDNNITLRRKKFYKLQHSSLLRERRELIKTRNKLVDSMSELKRAVQFIPETLSFTRWLIRISNNILEKGEETIEDKSSELSRLNDRIYQIEDMQ